MRMPETIFSRRGRPSGGLWRLVAAICALMAASSTPALGEPGFGDPAKLSFPPLPEVKPAEPQRFTLDNGLVVYMLEDHDLPLVDVGIMIKGGRAYEPYRLRGLGKLTGRLLRSGGAGGMTPDSLDEFLEATGSRLSVDVRRLMITVSGSFLTDVLDEGLAVFASVLREPRFDPERLEVAMVEMRTEIGARNDDPSKIAGREIRNLIYGRESPMAWYPEYETLERITRDDVVRFYERFFHPDRALLTVYGDFETQTMLQKIEELLGDWPRSSEPLPPLGDFEPEAASDVYFVDRPNAGQTVIIMGHLGMLSSDPDYAAMHVLQEVLTGSLAGRVSMEIRTRRGLAYASGGWAGTGWLFPGIWNVLVMVQSDSAVTAARLLRREIERVVTEPVSPAELERARESILNRLVFDISDKQEVLRRRARYEFYDYPSNFLERYIRKVKELGPQDLLEAARRHIHPDKMTTLIVGPVDRFAEPLESLGRPVHEVDVTIPPPPKALEVPEPTGESLSKGAALMKKAAEAHGGQDAFASVKGVHWKAQVVTKVGRSREQSIDVQTVAGAWWKLPDRHRDVVNFGMQSFEQVVVGDRGWGVMAGEVRPLDLEDIADMRARERRSLFQVLGHVGEMRWQYLGERDALGGKYEAVFVPDEVVRDWVVYIDPETNLIVGMEYSGTGAWGPSHIELQLSDYREVDGLLLPFEERYFDEGDLIRHLKMTEYVINPELPDSLFAPPEP